MNANNNNQELQKEIYLNQYRQNPYLINMNNQIIPYPFVQFPVMYPFISLTNQNPVQGNNLNNTNKYISNNNTNENERPSTTINFSNSYKINNDTNSQNNENKYNTISNRPISNTNSRYNNRKMPDTTFNIFKNDIDPEKIKLEKEIGRAHV